MQNEKGLLTSLDEKFGVTGARVKNVMGHMDEVLGKASRSLFCYVFLFTLLIVLILWKLT